MKDIVLTKKHLDSGLTDDDFSEYAGHPVYTFFLSDFPHWDTLLNTGGLLRDEAIERQDAMVQRFNDGTFKYIEGRPGTYELCARDQSPTVVWQDRIRLGVSGMQLPADHFKALASGLLSPVYRVSDFAGMQRVAPLLSLDKEFVVPAFVDEPIYLDHLRIPVQSFILRQPPGGDPIKYWAFMSGIPENRLAHYPRNNLYALHSDLHEMRHTVQAQCCTSGSFAETEVGHSGFYKEADADLFANAVLERAGVGQEVVTAKRHARYFSMLRYGSMGHNNAPLVDALKEGVAPPNYKKISGALHEVLARVAVEACEILDRGLGHHILTNHREWRDAESIKQGTSESARQAYADDTEGWQRSLVFGVENAYWSWVEGQGKKRPELVCSVLKKLVDDRVFVSPLAQSMGEKIIAAAEYFNPDLTQETGLANKIKLTWPLMGKRPKAAQPQNITDAVLT